jgi:hypothetical protein
MTYIAGWKLGNSAYLMGDMAWTGGPLGYDTSSFGQRRGTFQGRGVEEAALKVVPIAPGAALAFAGNVAVAENLSRFIVDNYDASATAAQIFAAVQNSNGPFTDPRKAVEILLARAPAGAPPTLTHWSSAQGIIKLETDFADAGSLDSCVVVHAKKMLDTFRGCTEEEHLLARITSSMQIYGLHSDLMSQGVGGMIWGLRVSQGKTMWQDDTAYVVYEDIGIRGSHFALAAMRNDIFMIYSSFTKQIRYFGHPFLSDKSLDEWRQAAQMKVPRGFGPDFDPSRWRYCSAYGLDEKRVAFIRRESVDIPSRHFKFEPESRAIWFLPELTGLLQRRVSSPKKMGYGYLVDRPGPVQPAQPTA